MKERMLTCRKENVVVEWFIKCFRAYFGNLGNMLGLIFVFDDFTHLTKVRKEERLDDPACRSWKICVRLSFFFIK